MLVLSRKVSEGITIGDSIHVTVVEIRGDRVRLGLDAPQDIVIYRDELRQHFACASKEDACNGHQS